MFLTLIFSCSFQLYDQVPCTSSSQCQFFGAGAVCSQDSETQGYCIDASPTERCNSSYPEGILTSKGSNWDNHRDDLIIGALFDHQSDMPNVDAVNLAAKQIADFGGLESNDFIIIHCSYEDDEDNRLDGLSGQDAVQEATRFLIEELRAPVVIGPAGSSDALFAFEIAKKDENTAVLISPSATSPSLTDIDGITKTDESPGLFWRTIGSDVYQTEVMSQLILDTQASIAIDVETQSRLTIVYQDSAYGRSFQEELKQHLSELDADAVLDVSYVPFDQIEDLSTSSLIGSTGIVFISSDISDVTTFLDDVALSDALIYLADGAADEQLLTFFESLDSGQDFSGRLYGTRPGISSTEFDSFASAYKTFSGREAKDNPYAAYTYDATWMAISGYTWAHFNYIAENSTENAPQYTGIGIATGLRKLSSTDSEEIFFYSKWPQIQGILSSGQSVNVSGASSKLNYNLETEELESAMEIWRIIPLEDNNYCFSTQQLCTIEDGCSVLWTEADATICD